MRRIHSPTINRSIIIAISLSCLLLPLFTSTFDVQAQEVRTITIDKLKPAKPPEEEQRDQVSKESTNVQPLTPSCRLDILVLLDDIKQVRIVAFNGPRNTTVNFTTAQTVAGILGMSHSVVGPFVASIVVPVPLDGNGNGQSEIFFVRGNQLGNTTLYATSVEMGNTTVLDYEVIPQCNCPPIPNVP